MKKQRKRFNPATYAIENATISAGTMMGVGIVGKLGETFPSPVSSKIIGGMEPLAMLPTLHVTGGVFQSLNMLDATVKRKRKR